MRRRTHRQFQEWEIDMEDRFQQLETESEDKDSVLSFNCGLSMFRVHQIVSAIKQAFYRDGLNAFSNMFSSRGGIPGGSQQWSSQGVECEMLKPGAKGWRKGKLRIRFFLEFCPDEPDVEEKLETNQLEISKSESPFEDIRQMMNGNS